MFTISQGCLVQTEKLDFDYSYYLGPNPKSTRKQAPVRVANHTSFLDHFTYQGILPLMSYLAQIELKKNWLLGSYMRLMQSIFVDRKDKNSKDKAMQDLLKRANAID